MSVTSLLGPEQRVQQDPFDVDAWNLLLRENQRRNIDKGREFYETLVTQFPSSGRYWRAYIEHELRSKNYENVEKLFTRCLVKVLNIDLWKSYLSYVRETKGNLPSFREKMAQAYDFALEKIGLDMNSYQVYADYTAFLRQVPASGSYQEYQKIAAVRKIYHRGVVTPIFNVDQLWAEYCNFEKSINAHLAEKLIAEKNKDYQVAKRVAKTLENTTRGLNRQIVGVPPRGTPDERRQVDAWKRYIHWEKQNPLQTEDLGLYSRRVAYAFEQALLCLGYHPDIWYEAALFLQDASKKLAERGDAKLSQKMADDVTVLYERACGTLLKDCALIYFAYADYEESRMRYAKVEQIYQRFIDQPNVDPTLTYVQYMKFARRTEGIKAARVIFRRARDDARCKYHVYIAAALMEFYCSKDIEVATRIFDLGLTKYGHEADYVLACIDFRGHMNDDNNTRVLFERVLTSGNLPADKSLEIWDRYLEFETRVGDLNSVLKVDERRREAASAEVAAAPTLLLIDRYRLLDLAPCSSNQLRMLGYAKGVVASSQVVSSTTAGPSGEPSNGDATNTSTDGFPRPDTTQMIPFKPKILPSNSHPIPGGVFPPPPVVSELMLLLPPPWCFNGPFVGVNMLMDTIRNVQLPDESPRPDDNPLANGNVSGNSRLNEIKKDMYQLLATTPDPMQVLKVDDSLRARPKRGLTGGGGDSDEEGSEASAGVHAPSHDIYRLRQQKRVK